MNTTPRRRRTRHTAHALDAVTLVEVRRREPTPQQRAARQRFYQRVLTDLATMDEEERQQQEDSV